MPAEKDVTAEEETRQIAIRLPAELLDRLEAHAQRLKRASRGRLAVTRADAIRDALTAGLERLEAQERETTTTK